jgi:hypothetical protein
MTRAPEQGALASLIKTTSQKHRWCRVANHIQPSRSIKERLHGAASHHITINKYLCSGLSLEKQRTTVLQMIPAARRTSSWRIA